jgi:hypothetical protein
MSLTFIPPTNFCINSTVQQWRWQRFCRDLINAFRVPKKNGVHWWEKNIRALVWRAFNLTSFSPCLTGPVDYLCETKILLLALSRYIGDPNVIDHHGLVWGGLHPEPSLGPRADNVIIPLDLTQLSCPGFTLAAGLLSIFTTDGVGCWGGSPVESLQSHFILTMSHWSSGLPVSFPSQGTQVQIPRGVLMWNQDSPVSAVSLH